MATLDFFLPMARLAASPPAPATICRCTTKATTFSRRQHRNGDTAQSGGAHPLRGSRQAAHTQPCEHGGTGTRALVSVHLRGSAATCMRVDGTRKVLISAVCARIHACMRGTPYPGAPPSTHFRLALRIHVHPAREAWSSRGSSEHGPDGGAVGRNTPHAPPRPPSRFCLLTHNSLWHLVPGGGREKRERLQGKRKKATKKRKNRCEKMTKFVRLNAATSLSSGPQEIRLICLPAIMHGPR